MVQSRPTGVGARASEGDALQGKWRPAAHHGLLAWIALRVSGAACFAAALSCSAPSKGGLMLAISTDMQTPKDINVVSVFITTGGKPKFNYIGRVLPDGTVALPATLAVVEPDQANAQVRIRVTAFQEQTARVLRDVLTTVPHGQTSLLRLPLSFLDDGSATGMLPTQYLPLGVGGKGGANAAPEGDTGFDPTTIPSKCNFEKTQQTSINGKCVSATVDSSQLPPYDPSQVYGDGGLKANGAPTSCFDAERCFAGAMPVTGLDPGTCTFPLPSGADPAALNLALANPTTGACVAAGQCYVPLVNDRDEGWTIQGSTVTLPAGVCAKLGGGVTLVAASACATETASEPLCESTGMDAGVFLDATAEADGTADAGAADGGVDSTVDGSSTDATVLDAGSDVTAMDSPSSGDATAEVDTGMDAGGCEAGLALCSGQCIDTTSDPTNCGGCGITCSGCAYGRCAMFLVTSQVDPQGIAHDATNVYWGDNDKNAILKSPLDGGAVTTLASGTYNIQALAADGTNVYWTDGSSVSSVPAGGGAATQLGQGSSLSVYGAAHMAQDANNVYWTSSAPVDGTVSGVIVSVPKGGGTVSTLVSEPDGWRALAVDATNIYWTNLSLGTVEKAPLTGGTPTTLASGQVQPSGIALYAGTLYWKDSGGGIVSVPTTGGTPTTLAVAYVGISGDVAADSTSVYWVDSTHLMKLPLSGGTPTTLATGWYNQDFGLTVGSANAYWVTGTGGVLSASIAGGAVTTLASGIASGQVGGNGTVLSVGANNLYAAYESGSILAVPLDGGALSTLASGEGKPTDIAAGPSHVAWSNEVFPSVVVVPIAGGTPTTVASEHSLGVAVDATRVYWVSALGVQAAPLTGGPAVTLAAASSAAEGLAVDSNYAYWADQGTGSILRVPLGGGQVATLASGQASPWRLAVTPSEVVWTNAGDGGSVVAVSLDGGPPTTLAAGVPSMGGIAVDSTNVYWSPLLSLLKVPLAGGAVTTLSTGNYEGVAVDSVSAYFRDTFGNLVKVTPK